LHLATLANTNELCLQEFRALGSSCSRQPASRIPRVSLKEKLLKDASFQINKPLKSLAILFKKRVSLSSRPHVASIHLWSARRRGCSMSYIASRAKSAAAQNGFSASSSVYVWRFCGEALSLLLQDCDISVAPLCHSFLPSSSSIKLHVLPLCLL
jgi:hypothetical protein